MMQFWAAFFWLSLVAGALWFLRGCWRRAVRAHRDLQRFNQRIEASAKLLEEREDR